MDKTTTADRPASSAAQYEAVVDGCLAEIRWLQDRMEEDRAEIESLQAETRTILDGLLAVLKAF